jgi:hypothetical protein|tara:strand:- start:243 stop:644 length:402 start_codon:yes stop_codon:yes gene_type:complete
MSKPQGLTEHDKDKVLVALKTGVTVKAACPAAGVSYKRVLAQRKVDPEFDDACIEARAYAANEVEKELYAAATAGESWAIKEWLRVHGGDDFKERSTPAAAVQVNVAGKEAEVKSVGELQQTLQERKELLEGE